MKKSLENQVRPLIRQFVEAQNGRYREHCSDKFLEALLLRQMSQPAWPHRTPDTCRAEALLNGDINVAYEAACPIFENLLESQCGVVCNGHHVAQDFAEALSVLLPAPKSA
jgi:hypothetical protein